MDFLTRTGKLCSDKRQEFISAVRHAGRFHAGGRHQPSLFQGRHRVHRDGPVLCAESAGSGVRRRHSRRSERRPAVYRRVDFCRKTVSRLRTPSSTSGTPTRKVSTTCSCRSSKSRRLRARFHSDAQGRFRFWTIMPKYYPIPDDGTVGEMLKASARHPYRPAHVHFMIVRRGASHAGDACLRRWRSISG